MGSSSSRPAAPDDAAQSLKRSKKNLLVPLLRSMSCGASSSWRTDSFMQESRITSGDRVPCQATLEKSVPCDGQDGSCRLQSIGEDCDRKASDDCSSGYVSSVSQQSTDHLFVPGIEGTMASSLVTSHSPNVAASANYSLVAERTRNRYCLQADTQANNISRSPRPFAPLTSSNEHLLASTVSQANPLSDQLTSEGNETNLVSSLGGSLRVDTFGEVSELENSANPAEWERDLGSFQNGTGLESQASVVAHSSQDTLTAQDSDLGVLHVEALGLVAQTLDESSSLLRGDSSGREARRNNRRRLWDALTRATSRRRRLSPSLLLANDDIDGLSTWNDDWGLFDWNSSEESSVGDESGMSMRRSSNMEERRWRSRPQVWALQQFSNSMEGSTGRSRHCAFGRHPNGHCSCEAFVMTEESSTRASISRIVMLAEALFEVLDEIHRQSVALSRSTSLSVVSLPAPEAIVDSFAVRIHKRADKSDHVLGQCAECYICLIEYEEGDHIRVLPCCHEFHVSCVDKWLKEVHRVCPLCRGNVCEETVTTSQAPAA
eukprot:c16434_g1_i1 orf=228-1868(+)